MAAYLADDDAEVFNLTSAAVQQDALAAALDLTALAADVVIELAASKGGRPQQVLRSLGQGKTGELLYSSDPASHNPAQSGAVQVVYPASLDDYDWTVTEAKGWIEVVVRWSGREKAITFYDPTRLAQEVRSAMTVRGYFAERAVAVVPTVTREAIEAAVALMAQHDFADVV
ncbi:hypothetical protein GCM10022225_83010 [Plantactinospora mayteni]|uniref:Uncharacterized protein n=1 Tax=Plantactinospora mayteni TaxID=566021 RepID=A0ABQ4F4E8_9ACTN|nr:hypothetical protein [Plantactinospora mayteni]GIH01786.1 hypothetical protein Pma05_83580 [Plantactinospora mayteni]